MNDHCFLYAKLIRDLIMCGLGGFVAYLIVRFRMWIIMSIGAILFFTFGWIWGVPYIKACDCPSGNKDYVVTPFDLSVRRWRWQRGFAMPLWAIWTLLAPPIAIGLVSAGWIIYEFGAWLYHRYWVC